MGGRHLSQQARAPGTDDYGWPSLYALNAVGLPFFAMRYWYGGFGISAPYSESYPIWTALSCLAQLANPSTLPQRAPSPSERPPPV